MKTDEKKRGDMREERKDEKEKREVREDDRRKGEVKGEIVAGSDEREERWGWGVQPGTLRGYWVVDSQSLSA